MKLCVIKHKIVLFCNYITNFKNCFKSFIHDLSWIIFYIYLDQYKSSNLTLGSTLVSKREFVAISHRSLRHMGIAWWNWCSLLLIWHRVYPLSTLTELLVCVHTSMKRWLIVSRLLMGNWLLIQNWLINWLINRMIHRLRILNNRVSSMNIGLIYRWWRNWTNSFLPIDYRLF